MKGFYLGTILVILSAVGFGLVPIFALNAYQGGASVATLLFLRFFIAAVCFFSFIIIKGESWRVSRYHLAPMFLLGAIFYAMQSSFYFTSVKYIPASLAALLLYTYPIIVAVLSVVVDKEKLSRNVIIAIGISLGGLALVLGAPLEGINFFGICLALGAACVYSCYIIIGNRVVSKIPPLIASAYIAFFASISLLSMGLVSGDISFQLDTSAWIAAVSVSICSTVIAMLTFFKGLTLIGPTNASALSMLEPLVTIAFSMVLLQESLSLIQGIGGAFVLTGALMVILVQGQQKRAECREREDVAGVKLHETGKSPTT